MKFLVAKSIQLSAVALARSSRARISQAAAQTVPAAGRAQLRNISVTALNPDGSARIQIAAGAGTITACSGGTSNQTPEIEFRLSQDEIKLAARGHRQALLALRQR